MKKAVLSGQKTDSLTTRLMKWALLMGIPVLAAFYLLLPACVLAQQEIIVDATSTNISDIPADWISVVKNMTLHHTGQSHGRQVPHGLSNLENQNSTYDQTQSEGGIPAGNGLKITRGQRTSYNNYTVSVGPDRFWLGDSGLDYTRRTLDYHFANGNTIDASLHTWCWHLRSWSASQVEDYFTSMEQLESEYPDVIFIYMTDTCDKSGSSGYNRFLRNEQIRKYCRENNKVLFDFADLESWSADGSHQNTYSYGGISNIPLIHSDWESGIYYDDGHINEAACTMKAKAMWWLLARIAGWDGSPGATDGDADGIADDVDNCPKIPNGSSLGSCFNNISGDVWATCTNTAECQTNNEWYIWCDNFQGDADSDDLGNVCDNCPDTCNYEQMDGDGDGIGDRCDWNPGCGGCGLSVCEGPCGGCGG